MRAPSSSRGAGRPYDAITEELGYKSRGSVSKAVWRTIDRRGAAAASRERELQRLDALERAHWARPWRAALPV